MTKEWVKHKETILVLYKDQGKTLKEVMEIMEIRHGFKASIRAYRSRFDKWGIHKYSKAGRKQSTVTPPADTPQSTVSAGVTQVDAMYSPSPVGPTRVRSYSGPIPSNPSLYSPEATYLEIKSEPYGSSDSPITLTSHNLGDQQQYYTQPAQPNSYASRISSLPENICLQGQEKQQMPAVQNHQCRQVPESSHCNDSFAVLYTLLVAPKTAPQDTRQRVQLMMLHIKNLTDHPGLKKPLHHGLNALELYIQNFILHESILDCFQIIACFIRAGADTAQIVPPNFSQTVGIGCQSGDLQMISAVLQRQQQCGKCSVPSGTVIWVSTCIENLGGDQAAVDQHLGILPYFLDGHYSIDTQTLRELLPHGVEVGPPLSPITPVTQVAVMGNHNIW